MKTRNLFFGLFGIFILATLMSGCSGSIYIKIDPAGYINNKVLHTTERAAAEPVIDGSVFYGTDCDLNNNFFGTYPLKKDSEKLGLHFHAPDGYHPGLILFSQDSKKWETLGNLDNPKVNIVNKHNGTDYQYFFQIYYVTTNSTIDNLHELQRSNSPYIGPVIVKLNIRHYVK